MKKNDGGPAFPVPEVYDQVDDIGVPTKESGMTLRDWFAGKALPTVCRPGNSSIKTEDDAAAVCYSIADAMLKERSKDETKEA